MRISNLFVEFMTKRNRNWRDIEDILLLAHFHLISKLFNSPKLGKTHVKHFSISKRFLSTNKSMALVLISYLTASSWSDDLDSVDIIKLRKTKSILFLSVKVFHPITVLYTWEIKNWLVKSLLTSGNNGVRVGFEHMSDKIVE